MLHAVSEAHAESVCLHAHANNVMLICANLLIWHLVAVVNKVTPEEVREMLIQALQRRRDLADSLEKSKQHVASLTSVRKIRLELLRKHDLR